MISEVLEAAKTGPVTLEVASYVCIWRGACLRVLGARAASAESMWPPAGASALLCEALPS